MASTSIQNAAEKPWYAAYPESRSQPATLSRRELRDMIHGGKVPGRDLLIVDLRRTDHEVSQPFPTNGGTIAGSINLPAQTLHPTIPTLYNFMKAARIPLVVWFCGSSKGRGNRAAAWFADYIKEQNKEEAHTNIESKALLEGIKGWALAGDEFTDLMEGYDAAVWSKA
ncbi:hypothetical protein MBLNU457_4573t3 [Dothideomycetes sp. NU457]